MGIPSGTLMPGMSMDDGPRSSVTSLTRGEPLGIDVGMKTREGTRVGVEEVEVSTIVLVGGWGAWALVSTMPGIRAAMNGSVCV